MNRISRLLFIAIYTLLAAAFLAVHLMQVMDFTSSSGGIDVRGRSSVGTSLSPPHIRRLKITLGSTEITIRKREKVVLITDDGIRHPLNIEGWKKETGGIRVTLSQNTSLQFLGGPREMTVIPDFPQTVPPVRSVEFSFGAVPGSEPEMLGSGVFRVTDPEHEYTVTLPGGSEWNQDSSRLNLVVLNKAEPVVRISTEGSGTVPNVLEWLEQGDYPSSDDYLNGITEWAAKTRDGWVSRIDSVQGLWTGDQGGAAWSDELASVILADSVQRNDLSAGTAFVQSVGSRASGSIGWRPSPYLGNIVNQTQSRRNQLNSAAGALSGTLQSGAFEIRDVLTTLVDTGNRDAAVQLVSLARNLPEPASFGSGIAGQLAVLQESRALGLGDFDSAPLIESSVFPRIFWLDGGLWVIGDDGTADLDISMRIGALLLTEARHTNDIRYQSVGRQLILSALNFADSQGMIPAKIIFEENTVTEGLLNPERYFQPVMNFPSYPRHVSLSEQLAPGSWALTAAGRFDVQSTPAQTSITMDFPPGFSHHIAISGIRRFREFYMNDIRWNGDPNFQRYYAGWFYDAAEETLYIKIRHRVTTETIRIVY